VVMKRGYCSSPSESTHTHTVYSDELDHETLKQTPPSAASPCCTTNRERLYSISHSVYLILSHTNTRTHTDRHVLQGRSECWFAKHSGPPSPSSSFSLSSLTLSLPLPFHLVCSGSVVCCCVRTKASQQEACRVRALADLSPPTNIQSRVLRRRGSLDQVGLGSGVGDCEGRMRYFSMQMKTETGTLFEERG